MLQRRFAARLLSGVGTGVPSFWLPTCVPAVPPNSGYDDQNT